MYKNFKLSIVLLLTLQFLTGCSVGNKEVEEKPIQIALTQDLLSFDPMMTSDIFSEAILRNVYTTLYDFDENLQLRKLLVESEKRIDDYTWEFKIHDDVKFHDNSTLTSDDVVFSIQRAMAGGRTQKALEILESVRKIDDTTIEMVTTEPYSEVQSLFAKAETSIVSKKAVETEGYDFTKPVGCGPFKFVERIENEKIALERFDDYYLEKAKTKYLNFLVIVREQDRTTALLNGDVDILFSVSAYDCDKLKLSDNVNLIQSPSSKIEYLSLNTNVAPFDNQKVRLAMSYAINRQKITDSVYHGYSVPSVSLIPEGIMGYKKSDITYNPEEAKRLLEESGYGDGFEFDVITIDTIRKNTLELIKLDLANIGITLNYNLVTMQEAASMMSEGKHESILVGWAFNNDPNGVLPILLGSGSGKTQNSSNYSNPSFDQLLIDARKESNKDEKQAIYEEINNIVTNDSPIIVLQNPMILSATLNDIQGVYVNPQGLIQYNMMYRESK